MLRFTTEQSPLRLPAGGRELASSRADFGTLIAEEIEKRAKVVKFSGAKPDSMGAWNGLTQWRTCTWQIQPYGRLPKAWALYLRVPLLVIPPAGSRGRGSRPSTRAA